MYTNIRVPYEVLLDEWCRPLEIELNFANKMKRPTTTNHKTEEKFVQKLFNRIKFLKSNPNFGQCPICLEEMSSAARITDCAHIFHAHCLRKSLELVGDSCPMCRNPILDGLVKEEQDIQYYEAAYWQQHI